MHGKQLEAYITWVTATFARARSGPCSLLNKFDDHTFSAFAAHKKRIPDWIAVFSMLAFTAEHEPNALGRAVGAV